MVKVYVLDTNVLVQAPYACECFEENRVVLPLVVLEELDNLKKAEGERGQNARSAIRYLEGLRQRGDLLEGVSLESGGTLRVEKNFVNVRLPEDLPEDKMDNRILRVCRGLAESGPEPVILVTKDILLRVKAQMIGVQAEDFVTEQVSGREEQYRGRTEVYAPEEAFKEFKKKGIPLELVYQSDPEGKITRPKLLENEFVLLKADQSTKKTQLGRVEKGLIKKQEHMVSGKQNSQHHLVSFPLAQFPKRPEKYLRGEMQQFQLPGNFPELIVRKDPLRQFQRLPVLHPRRVKGKICKALRRADASLVRVFPQQQPQKSCLAFSISPDQPQFPVCIQIQGYMFENLFRASLIAEAKIRYHNLCHFCHAPFCFSGGAALPDRIFLPDGYLPEL